MARKQAEPRRRRRHEELKRIKSLARKAAGKKNVQACFGILSIVFIIFSPKISTVNTSELI
jgi:hypothetical protein